MQSDIVTMLIGTMTRQELFALVCGMLQDYFARVEHSTEHASLNSTEHASLNNRHHTIVILVSASVAFSRISKYSYLILLVM